MEIILYIILVILLVIVVLLVWQFKRAAIDWTPLSGRLDGLQDAQERTDRCVREEIARSRTEMQTHSQQERTELAGSLKSFEDSVQTRMAGIAKIQNDQMESFARQLNMLTVANEQKLDNIRLEIDAKLKQIQEDSARQLDRMRETVDEKLQNTLEKRLGESFKQVSERLEQVHQGLGDMRTLATGVGDLKKVLTNVKSRGTWGEVQLGALLEEILSPEQYLKMSRYTSMGAICRICHQTSRPGRFRLRFCADSGGCEIPDGRLLTADGRPGKGDVSTAERRRPPIENSIKKAARDISQKYLAPPKTTDFGIMFLPSEGLYAEVIRRTVLVSNLQREYRIVISGPSTFAAFLNSLQMGFRTLAIQKRSGEVWKVLGEVKAAFGRFDSLDAVRKDWNRPRLPWTTRRKRRKRLPAN